MGNYRRIGGYRPGEALRRFGDAYVETRLILDQLFELGGRRYLGNATDLRGLMRALYDNALMAGERLGLTFGVALTPAQTARLRRNLVWLEVQMVRGERVLVPRVYLAAASRAHLAGAQIRAGEVDLRVAALLNSGQITGPAGAEYPGP